MYHNIEFNINNTNVDKLQALIAASPSINDPKVWGGEYLLTDIHFGIQDKQCVTGSFRYLDIEDREALLDTLLNMAGMFESCEVGSYIATHKCNPVEGSYCSLAFIYQVTE